MDDWKLAAELFSIRIVVAINAATVATLVTHTDQAEFVHDQRKLALDAVKNANITGNPEDVQTFKENCRSSLASIYNGINFSDSQSGTVEAIMAPAIHVDA